MEPRRRWFTYEKLTTFCFVCGKMGYMESLCDRLFAANGEPLEQGWGPNLRVLDTRNTITYGGKWLRKKDGGSSGGPRIGSSGERNDTGNSVSQSKNYGKLVNDDLNL